MSQEDESGKLFDTVDALADQQLQELHQRVEQARDCIDGAGRSIVAQLRGEAVVPPSSLRVPAEPELSAPPFESSAGLSNPSIETARLAHKPTLQDAPDFGDIAATIATDDEWKKR